jgi:hypothetical protein
MKRCNPGVLLLALLPAAALAGPPTDSPAAPATGAAAQLSPADLVRRLGGSSYHVRCDASERLAALGRAAVAALEAGAKNNDPEVRRRCLELLPAAKRTDLEIEIDLFVADNSSKRTFPGWPAFRDIVGNDRASRSFFGELYKTDRPVLERLAKDPKTVGGEFPARCQKLQGRPWGGTTMVPGEPEGLLLAAALAPTTDQRNFWFLVNACHRPEMALVLGSSPVARRLLGRALAARAKDENMVNNVVPLAVRYGLTEFCKDTLEPLVRDMATKVKPDDWRFYNVVYAAQQLGLRDLIESKLRPALREAAANMAKDTAGDIYRLGQLVNIAQALGMRESIEDQVRPAALRMLTSAAEHPTDFSRFYQARYLSQVLKLEDAFDAIVKPSLCRYLVEQSAKATDLNQVQQLIHLAQMMNAETIFEAALRPAARRLILQDLEQPEDFNKLSRSATLASQVRLTDLMEDTLKPVVRRQAAPLKDEPPDANRINQFHNLAQTLAMKDVIEDSVKPAFLRLCQSRDYKLQPATFQGILNLAKALRAKEAVPLLLRGASAKEMQPWDRANAIFFIGDICEKGDLAKLEPLLKDTAGCGDCGINSTMLHAEVRDVALAVLIHKSGEKLADYGFPYFQIVPGADPFQSAPCYMGFPGATERDAALKKWQASQSSKKK